MTREQAINSMISHGFKVEQVGEIIKAVTPQEPQTFKWCTDCKEYDQEKHCCHRWSKVIRDTVEEMKQEQEPRWIPISEKLPKKNVEVLATTEWGAVTIAEMYSVNDWFIHEGTTNAETDEIAAWMPLPQPYREVTE